MTVDPRDADRVDGGPRVVLGVSGGVAAYKACELLRRFTESGHQVRVVPTEAALRFVGEATWAALSGRPVATHVWADAHEVPHVALGRWAQLVIVAPATADLLARAAHGLADDLLANILLTATCPVILAPAMHTEMWRHPATAANVATLRSRGVLVLDPATGALTSGDTGVGRLPDVAELYATARLVLRRAADPRGLMDLAGLQVLVTAGGTREPLDPVRFLGNRSSGRQGYALARTAVARGATVTLVSANVALPDPAGVIMVRVQTTAQLREATLAQAEKADIVVMAAAPADFRPAEYSPEKIKKGGAPPALALATNPDIAAELGARKRQGQTLVIFAAETAAGRQAMDHAAAKLRAKKADLVVLNEVGADPADPAGAERVFNSERNAVVLLDSHGELGRVAAAPKDEIAHAIWDAVGTIRGTL